MGVDVIYNKLNTAHVRATRLASTVGRSAAQRRRKSLPACLLPVDDQDAWTGTFRIQRDFLP